MAVPWQFPLCLYLLQRSVWEEILAGCICLPGVERSCHIGLTPASAIARRPELSPKTLKMCPPECKPAKKRLQRVLVCPDQPGSSSLLLSLCGSFVDTCPLLVEKQRGDTAVNTQISHTREVTCLESSSFSSDAWEKRKDLRALQR